MDEIIYIDDKWTVFEWINTGGTRAKKYLQAPDGKFYYFKRSQYKDATDTKPGKDFKYEFWNEIISYQLGVLLGFNVLKYTVAVSGAIMGCISESMINDENEELIEGVKYLQAFAVTYDPKNKAHQERYTFQMIENALDRAGLLDHISNLLEIIVFDALIGNGDRHQENWAVISKQRLLTDVFKLQTTELSRTQKFLTRVVDSFLKVNKPADLPKTLFQIEHRFAPIYDSGSSLGRELLDEKVELYLQSEKELERYINKGLAEIHWEGKKISHFQIIRYLLDHASYSIIMSDVLKKLVKNWDKSEIERIVNDIDKEVPESHNTYKIPERRKNLIIKIITLRLKKLEEMI